MTFGIFINTDCCEGVEVRYARIYAPEETPMPKLHPINSSVVSAAGYDSDTRELTVQLRSGVEYTYHDVPQEIYNGLMQSNSRGAYFVREISRSFRYTRGK